jgi:Phosphotransferase enzyme family
MSSVASSRLPNLQTLTAGLTSVLRSHESTGGQVTILDRQPNIYSSTFPSEIVTCRVDEGGDLKLFCKYAAGGHPDNVYGHRGGVAYEAAVYRHLLQPSQATTPRLYGTYTDISTGDSWLILEYLEKNLRLPKATGMPAPLGLAAHWIGRFHRLSEDRLSDIPTPFLIRYDAEYYLGWVRRSSLFAGNLHQRFPWLRTLCERSEEFIALLLTSPLTVIHGEYYGSNILFRGGRVYPVDWESAAVAAGEVDVAALTDGWPEEIARQCELEYQRVRWPEGSPADFERRLCAARLYLYFRWLGDRPYWTTHPGYLRSFTRLHSAGERLGLIGAEQ